MTARMAGDLPLPEVNLHQAFTGMDIHPLAHILVWYRVMVLAELNVVIDVDPAASDIDADTTTEIIGVMLPSSLCCFRNTHHEHTDVSCADGNITSRSILTDSLLPQ